ncbi:MAG: Asp-tRNA(Asn)/Glu-tRNA(Gln) amidotransferase GatCAB subunit B, partial [Thermoactinomyces sp.]
RSKEEAHDYRYFPEPDLVRLHIDHAWKEEIRRSIPELPDARKSRYIREYGLSDYDAAILTGSKSVADYFDLTVMEKADPKMASNWIITELLGYLNAEGKEISDIKMKPVHLAGMIKLIQNGTISSKIAKKVFKEMLLTGKDPEQIVKEKGLVQISDEGQIKEIVLKVLSNNPQSIEDFKNGKDRALGFLVGQVMKETRGKANPQLVNKLILEEIKK